jgi:putative two-component system response regulator
MVKSKELVQRIQRGVSNILLVDDEQFQRELEKEILSKDSYNIIEAENGEQALDLLKESEFDLVLIDKNMPGISGDEVCHRIRNEIGNALLPVIMVTASNSPQDLQDSMLSGATDFIKKPYDATEFQARVATAISQKKLTDQLESAESMLFALARMVEARDEGTGDHCSRLAHYAYVFGDHLGLNDVDMLALQRACVLHDIGKIGIPDRVLLKKGKLNDKEWDIMREHTVIGTRLCEGFRSMRHVVPVIMHHHERWDGTGYPSGLKGNDIPYLARIFQVLDIYDALSSERPYKEAFSKEKCIYVLTQEMEKGWRDPYLTSSFIQLLQDKPEAIDNIPMFDSDELGLDIFSNVVKTGYLDWLKEN